MANSYSITLTSSNAYQGTGTGTVGGNAGNIQYTGTPVSPSAGVYSLLPLTVYNFEMTGVNYIDDENTMGILCSNKELTDGGLIITRTTNEFFDSISRVCIFNSTGQTIEIPENIEVGKLRIVKLVSSGVSA